MMNTKKLTFILIGLLMVSLAHAQHQPLTGSEQQQFKAGVTRATQSLRSLESNFSQIRHLDFMENDIKSSGKLFFRSPDKISWEYRTPFSYQVVFNGKKMLVNDAGKKTTLDVSANRMMENLNNMLTGAFNGNNIFDEKQFHISYFKSGSNFRVALKPKDKRMAQHIAQIDLQFDQRSHLVKSLKIIEPSGDYTHIEFTEQQLNKTIADAKFAIQ